MSTRARFPGQAVPLVIIGAVLSVGLLAAGISSRLAPPAAPALYDLCRTNGQREAACSCLEQGVRESDDGVQTLILAALGGALDPALAHASQQDQAALLDILEQCAITPP